MKNHVFPALLAALFVVACVDPKLEPVDYVNPYAGNISHLLVPTYPTVQLPNSMLRIYPERSDYTSEYLNGLPVIVTNHRERSAFKLSVTTRGEKGPVIPVSYDNESITPYSFEVTLSEGEVKARYALSNHSAIYELKADSPFKVILYSGKGKVSWNGEALEGWQIVDGETKVYVYLEPEVKPLSTVVSEEEESGWTTLGFETGSVRLRYGISFIDIAQAKANLRAELTDYDIDALAAAGRKIWNETLGRISVKGPEKRKRVFYTSYYRTFERPILMSEDGRYWSAFDNSVHEDGGVPFYTDDWIWDTYRAAHPLRILMDRPIEENILASYLRMADQMGTGWMPTFPEVTGDSRRMNSNHGIPTFADALAKGLDIDVKAAFLAGQKALREKTLVPWSGNPAGALDEFYWNNGWFPALKDGEPETDPNVDGWEQRQPVAVSLGTAYDSWALSKLADAAGDKEAAEYYRDWSGNYRKLFNPETLFFHPKDKDGEFLPDVDYNFGGGIGGRQYYDENNAWVYRWDVQHNIPDLVSLMGGPDRFVMELDNMFATPLGRAKFFFYAKFPDHTGNVGQFSMANEPSLHIPYLYNYAGAPWKTQKRIRQMLDTWFRDDLMGVPGDEDGGGMTSFVVFSSLGFYPVTPGEAVYTIGSPVFEESEMRLSNGKVFRIKAKGVSDENKYIQSAALNGKPLDGPWITHEDIMAGGELTLEMGPIPNREWGAVIPKDREEWNAAGWEWKDAGDGAEWTYVQFPFRNSTQSISIARYPASGRETALVHAPGEMAATTDSIAIREGARIALNGSYFNMRRLIPHTFFSIDGEVLGRTPSSGEERSNGVLAIKDKEGHKLEILQYDSTKVETYRTEYYSALASGPVLMKEGKVPVIDMKSSFNYMRHPRTFIGWDDKGMVYMVVVDGRFPGQADGMSIPELATVARLLGLKDALNLDGGGSSTLWTDETGIINFPYDNRKFDHAGARKVPNIVIVK
ncbi:MAG: GH92 family glycosyl hydrolase [Bacteroidales bacterium]|nr:GH92 family glycosyl hydrolase [Bacteroidales bacterium]